MMARHDVMSIHSAQQLISSKVFWTCPLEKYLKPYGFVSRSHKMADNVLSLL
jgi:hypothetical protein